MVNQSIDETPTRVVYDGNVIFKKATDWNDLIHWMNKKVPVKKEGWSRNTKLWIHENDKCISWIIIDTKEPNRGQLPPADLPEP